MARLAQSNSPYLKQELGLNSDVGLEIPKISEVAFRPNHVFLLMRFSGDNVAARYEVMRRVCSALGLLVHRAD